MDPIGEFEDGEFEETFVNPKFVNPTFDELEEKYGISWKSTCFPLSPEFARKIDSDSKLRWDLKEIWRSKPEFPGDANQLDPSSGMFGTGGYLVRNNGDRVDLTPDTFKGKFVFVCCFHAPVLDARHVVNLCHDLYSTRDDVEVVMVAWINSLVDADDHQQVFDHFFSAFPKSCLAVPLEDSKQRANVYKVVSDHTSKVKYSSPNLVLDREGMVLPSFQGSAIYAYGSEAFPFTKEMLKDIDARSLQLQKACSLEQLLRINSFSPEVAYKFNPDGRPREEVNISELNNKLVGLYIPGRSGDLLPSLLDMYEQCRKKQLEFEVVVVYSEDRDDYLCLKLVQKMIDSLLLEKHDICRRWWCLPLDTSVSLRLNRLIPAYRNHGDRLCMVGPAGGFIDVCAAGKVMKTYGVDGYPFTRDAIIQKGMQKMREITLESVLLGDDVFRGTDRDDVVSSDRLLGKKVCMYFGSLYYMLDCEKVFSSYRETKAMDPEFEVVFVYPRNDLDGVEVYDSINAMPWYVCPVNLDRLESAYERLGISRHAIVGFGEDGRVRSCRSAQLATFTLDDTLYEDVSERHGHDDLPFPYPVHDGRRRRRGDESDDDE